MRFAILALMLFSLCVPALSSAYDRSPFAMNGLKLGHSRHNPDIWKNSEVIARVMKDGGMYWDRLELWWGVVEPEQGKFDWSFADRAVQFYRDQGMYAMPILCYSSAWSTNVPPSDAEERARYANYVFQIVSRYKDTFKVWEIWNEPNIPTFWPKPDVKLYTLMLQEAYKAAKTADPDCVVLAGSTSGPDLGFIKGIYANGGWDSCDGISIHPYSMCGGPITQRLDKLLRMHQDYIKSQGKPKSLWITEMGWTTEHKSWEKDQAAYLVQSYVISLANGVEKLFWFDLDDWSEKWGIVRKFEPFDPKPSYTAYKILAKALGSPGKCAAFQGYLRMPQGVACYVFKKSDTECVLVLWTDDPRISRAVSFREITPSWRLTSILGEEIPLPRKHVTVGGVPIIITGVNASDIGQVSVKFNPYIEKPGMNLLFNGSMEWLNHAQSADGWNPGRFEGSAKDGKLETVDERHSGLKSVRISQSGERCAFDQGPLPVDAGRKYRLTGWIKTENATGNNQIGLYWYSGNQWTYKGEVRSDSIAGTNDWTKVSVTGEVPDGATLVRPNLISENNSGSTWFDDMELTEVE